MNAKNKAFLAGVVVIFGIYLLGGSVFSVNATTTPEAAPEAEETKEVEEGGEDSAPVLDGGESGTEKEVPDESVDGASEGQEQDGQDGDLGDTEGSLQDDQRTNIATGTGTNIQTASSSVSTSTGSSNVFAATSTRDGRATEADIATGTPMATSTETASTTRSGVEDPQTPKQKSVVDAITDFFRRPTQDDNDDIPSDAPVVVELQGAQRDIHFASRETPQFTFTLGELPRLRSHDGSPQKVRGSIALRDTARMASDTSMRIELHSGIYIDSDASIERSEVTFEIATSTQATGTHDHGDGHTHDHEHDSDSHDASATSTVEADEQATTTAETGAQATTTPESSGSVEAEPHATSGVEVYMGPATSTTSTTTHSGTGTSTENEVEPAASSTSSQEEEQEAQDMEEGSEPTASTTVSATHRFGRFVRAVFASLIPKSYAQEPPALSRSRNADFRIVDRQLIGPDNVVRDDAIFLATIDLGGELDVAIDPDGQQMAPGRYRFAVTLSDGTTSYVINQEFVWGVLAINIDQAQYVTGDEAYIQMAALTKHGDTLCDAALRLTVISPNGSERVYEMQDEASSSTEIGIQQSGECGDNNVTDVPDYFVRHPLHALGAHRLTLENTSNGFLVSETFDVVDGVDVRVIRSGATRINPFRATYRMRLTVEAVESLNSTLVETVPPDFDILGTNGGEVRDVEGAREIHWEIDLDEGQTKELWYQYAAPEVSPQLYFLGPARISETRFLRLRATETFSEGRQWQLASDAVGRMILFWDGTGDAPTGWTCISCGSGDAYQKFLRASSTYAAAVGGAASHSHSASAAVQTSTDGQGRNKGGSATVADAAHTHSVTPTLASTSSLPEYRTLKVIRANTTGEVDIPVDAIAVFDASVPSGYSQYSAHNGKYVYGENSIGTTGGTNLHQHDTSGTTGTGAGTADRSGSVSVSTNAHTHALSGVSGSVDQQPPFVDVILGQKTGSDASPPNDLIAMWDDEQPSGWDLISGSGDVLDSRFLKASTTYNGVAGGGQTHTHSNYSATADASGSTNTTSSGSGIRVSSHTHVVNISGVSTESHVPPFTDVVLAKRNVPPEPLITNLILNGGADIVLNEGTFAWATSTMLVTDEQGCDTIDTVTATAYLASTTNNGTTCTLDSNNCYPAVSCVATTTGNTCGVSDNTVEYDCGFKIWYNAIPTDTGAPREEDIWSVAATTTDEDTNTDTATNSAETVEMLSLVAIDMTGSIAYGSVEENTDTGATNQVSTTTNSGNRSINIELGGDNMKSGANVLSFGEQKHGLAPFTYSSGGVALVASTTPSEVVLDLARPTATTTAVTDQLYWGINIPASQATGSYTGTNYFTACLSGSCAVSPTKIDDASNFGDLPGGGRQIVRTTTGILYAGVNGDLGGQCGIWKSTDEGATWSEQDDMNNPGCDSSEEVAIAIDGRDIIYMLYADGSNVRSVDFYTASATTSQDTYNNDALVHAAAAAPKGLAIAVDSNNKPHAVWTDPAGTAKVESSNRVVGSAWDAPPVIVRNGFGDVFVKGSSLAINEDNRSEVAVLNVTDTELTVSVGTANDPASFQLATVDTSVNVFDGESSASIAIDRDGNTWTAYVDTATTAAFAFHPDSATWGSGWSTLNNSNDGSEPSMVADANDFYLIYENNTGDIAYDIYATGTDVWAGETVQEGGASNIDAKAKWSFFNNNMGSLLVDYLFSDGTDVFYNQRVLHAPVESSVNIDDASDFGTMLGSSRQIVRTTTGALYTALKDGSSCEIWKSADGGATWSEQDTGNNPACANDVSLAIDGKDVLHIVYRDESIVANVQYISFNTTDATTTQDQFGTEETADSAAGVGAVDTQVVIDSNDKPHILWTDSGLSSEILNYTNKINGSWATTVTIESVNFANGINRSAIAMNEDNIPEVAYINSNDDDLTAAVGNQNNATSFTLHDVDANVNDTTGEAGVSIAIDSGGNTWVAYTDTTKTAALAHHPDGAAWASGWTTDNNANDGSEPSITIASGEEVYLFYENNSDDIAYDTYSTSTDTWLGETIIESGTTNVDAKAKWSFFNGNAKDALLDYLFSDGTDVFYNVIELH